MVFGKKLCNYLKLKTKNFGLFDSNMVFESRRVWDNIFNKLQNIANVTDMEM